MSTFKHVEEWYQDNQDLVVKYVDDPELILTSENGNKKGVYLASVKMIVEEEILIPMYVGEAGGDEEHDRSISDRLKEHLRHWLGDYTEHYTGVKKSELESGKMKFHFSIVAESSDIEKRKKMEEDTIRRLKPYLQYGAYPKYHSDYKGLDLCIIPMNGTRRKALLDQLKEKGITLNETIIDQVLDVSFQPDWKKAIKLTKMGMKKAESIDHVKQNMNRLRTELRPGTDEYRKIKRIVDKNLGYARESTGCTYPCLIRILAYALT